MIDIAPPISYIADQKNKKNGSSWLAHSPCAIFLGPTQ